MPKGKERKGAGMAELRYRITSDILFKTMFASHEDLLRSLVAAALGIKPSDIKSLEIKDPEIMPESIGGMLCHLVLNMEVDDEFVDLEIQVADEGYFKERALYYWSKLFVRSLEGGEDYALAPRTVLISILDFDLFDCQSMHSVFALQEKKRHELLTDKLGLHFFELNKLPEEIDTSDMMKVWLKLIAARTEEDLAALEELDIAEIAQAVDAYWEITASPRFQELERMRAKARRDEAQAIENARRQGLEQGLKQQQEDTARRLLEMGFTIRKISEVTVLTTEEIESIVIEAYTEPEELSFHELMRIRERTILEEEKDLNNARRQERKDTARRLLAMGFSIEQISEATELTPEEIESLG